MSIGMCCASRGNLSILGSVGYVWMAGLDFDCDPAARPEVSDHFGFSRLDGLDDVVENSINGFFVKHVAVPEREEVEL